jgi:PAS domain S-box-containing protein
MRERIIGLGEESTRKSFYPELQQQVSRLEQAQENLRTLFNAIPDAILITDLEGALVEVNDAALAMFGVTRENFRQIPLADYHFRENEQEPPGATWLVSAETLKTEGRVLREWTARRPLEGTSFEVEGSLRLGRWYQQEVILSVIRDITERKRLESMLRQSQKLDALGQLAGGMAHDTNNMLGVIIGYADMLEELTAEQPQFRQELGQIRKAALHSSDLIRQLLAFARKQSIQPQVVDLNHLAEESQRMLRRLIGENIRLIWKPATVLWNVWLDPSQVDQILANLTVNARDAIDGNGTITLETENQVLDVSYCQTHPDAVPGDYVVLSVTDTGRGMAPEVLSRIFEPFFTTKEAGRGTGLGLATVYGILRQNGGFITVYSTPALGTTFRLHFPRYHMEEAGLTGSEAPEPPPGGHETILLVEDETDLLAIQKAILEIAGYRVLAASRPLEAQALIRQERFPIDMLVTDLVMPDMNGWELHQWISLLRPGIRTLFMSGYPADTIHLEEALGPGRTFLQKPFSRAELLHMVRRTLDHPR